MSFAKRQAYVFKSELGLDLSIFRKGTGMSETRLSEKDPFLEQNFKNQDLFRKKFQILDLIFIFGSEKSILVGSTYPYTRY